MAHNLTVVRFVFLVCYILGSRVSVILNIRFSLEMNRFCFVIDMDILDPANTYQDTSIQVCLHTDYWGSLYVDCLLPYLSDRAGPSPDCGPELCLCFVICVLPLRSPPYAGFAGCFWPPSRGLV